MAAETKTNLMYDINSLEAMRLNSLENGGHTHHLAHMHEPKDLHVQVKRSQTPGIVISEHVKVVPSRAESFGGLEIVSRQDSQSKEGK
ncbi:MAG TPA: hypothetical protein VG965_01315 [Patescibacteria group bacterium]|nr:hypothetical protein [Patescibacteria group bacterium]